MATGLAVFVAILVGLLWIAGVFVLFIWGVENDEWRGWVFAALLFALGPAIVVGFSGGDEHANQLCLAGHQEWHTTHGMIYTGKVMVPTTSTSKAWVCERWEAQ